MITTRLGFTAAARAPRTSSARTMRRALVAGPPVLLAAALLGGCGGNGDPTGSGGSSATAMSSTGGGGPATTTTSSGGGAGGGTPELCPETMNTGADRPHVFWPKPVRAYPGIPFLFTLVAYDPDGGALCYGLDGAPAGMSIDARGTITWSPTDADAQKSPSAFKVQITNTRGGRVTVPVSLAVAKSGFLFVAPGGDDASDGSLAKPFATIRHGLDVVGQQKGATLLVRGGTYDVTWNWEVDGVKAPLGGIDFTADDPAEVRGYPGEDVVINCVNGHGLWAYATSYVLFADLAVKNVTVGERGGAISNGNHIVFQRVTVSDSNWADSNNCTGFKLDGTDVVAHRCDAHDNYDRNGHVWNNSNYLVYTDGGMQDVYILESTSEHSAGPGTGVGFKVKHAGPGKLTVFGSRDDGSSYGFGGQDDGTTVRFSTFVNNATAIHLGISDPNEFTKGGMTIDLSGVIK